MPVGKTEAEIEAAICRIAKKEGWLIYKFSSPNNRGVADRLFIKSGKTLFLEIKRPGNKPTKLQEKFLREIRSQGLYAYWTDSVADAQKLFALIAPRAYDYTISENGTLKA